LARLFGGGAPPRVPPTTPTSTSAQPTAPVTPAAVPVVAGAPQIVVLAEEAQAHYQRAIDAQRAGDWAKYGEEIRALGQTLDRMRQRERGSVFSHARSTSATLHACAIQPRGVNGSSESKISLIVPMPSSDS